MEKMSNHLYFKQIEIGPMQNYVYLIGSTETRKVAVVDAAWEIDTILKIAKQDEMEITHAFVTHTHPDHVGGGFGGTTRGNYSLPRPQLRATCLCDYRRAKENQSLSPFRFLEAVPRRDGISLIVSG